MATEKRLIEAIEYCKMLREEMDYLLELDKTKGYQTLKERMGLEVAIADLGDMPTVDAVEVVLCKDCQSHEPCMVRDRVWCRKMCRYMPKDGFCSEGKNEHEMHR